MKLGKNLEKEAFGSIFAKNLDNENMFAAIFFMLKSDNVGGLYFMILVFVIFISYLLIKAIKRFVKIIDTGIKYPKLKKTIEDKERKLFASELRINELTECIERKDELYGLLQGNKPDLFIDKLISIYSDFLTVQYDITARYLETKSPPARKMACEVRELKLKAREHIEKFKIMQYKYEALFDLFPELKDYADSFESLKELENVKNLNQLQDEYDRVRDYISKEEYQKLSTTERNQLALDNYIKGGKANWQIGRDYELFIGYRLWENDYIVQQYGIEKRLGDLGCDVIAFKNNEILIIQCKRWKEERKIHEKYMMYLYGTYILLKKNYKKILNIGLFDEDIKACFVSTHEPTDAAKEIAEILGIEISAVPFEEFPRIKCNMNNGNRIYHLPFDQQYDRTKIENEGEFYAWTIKEAEDAGFRRAHRWSGIADNKTNND